MSTTEKEYDAGSFIGEHHYCIIKEVPKEKWGRRKSCDSSDGLAVYEHVNEETGEPWYDGFCWACQSGFSEEEIKSSSLGSLFYSDATGKPLKDKVSVKKKRDPMTPEEKDRIFATSGFEGKMIRGIKDEYNKFYGHRTRLTPDGTPIARFYPETLDGKVVGYKCRIFPKDFSRGKVGLTGSKNELSGQVRFKNGGKYVLVVGGEEDKVAAFQMLRDSQIERGQADFDPIAVVSVTAGEGTAHRQLAAQLDFLDEFDYIVLGLDNDHAGNEAMSKAAKVLPKEKVKIAKWSGKDPNKMLLDGKIRQFLRDFYGAKDFYESGIKSSTEIDSEIEKELLIKKIGLPSFMHKLEGIMYGGIPLGYIVNIIGDTGIGKTEYVNAMILDWIFNSPHKVGVVSLELTSGQYGIAMLSKYIGRNLLRFSNGQDAVDYIKRPEIQLAREHLWSTEHGEPRWALLDERDGSVEGLQKQIERLVNQHGCKLIVIDVLSDLLEGLSNEEQGLHMKWQKNLIKKGVTIVNVVHSRKPPAGKDGKVRKITEYDAYGSSTIVKSAACNILISRDKLEQDPVMRNVTTVEVSKCRWSGESGEAGSWYYDPETRTSYEYEDYWGPEGHLTPQEVSGQEEVPERLIEVEKHILPSSPVDMPEAIGYDSGNDNFDDDPPF